MDIDKLRLTVQAIVAAAVLIGSTLLAWDHVVDSGAVIALYGAALGAVGSGAVGGIRAAQTNGKAAELGKHHTHADDGKVIPT